jgi:hypothetical protein
MTGSCSVTVPRSFDLRSGIASGTPRNGVRSHNLGHATSERLSLVLVG